jgi:histidine triad (HIT) family protein
MALDCIFCEILAGLEPAKVLADGISSIAIEPLNPVVDGHFIVIPRQHVKDAYEDPGVTAMSMHDASQWSKMFSWRDKRYESANLITSVGKPATQSVFHLHIHVVPRAENDGLALPWYSGKRSKRH